MDQYEPLADLKIVWNFEQEAELIWLMQLMELLYVKNFKVAELYIPYLPYGRQDKEYDNELTFARNTFINILSNAPIIDIHTITTLDIHSHTWAIHSYSPKVYIDKSIKEFDADVLVFPDSGAYNRYGTMYKEYNCLVLDKVRDQKTGWIASLKLDEELSDEIFASDDGIRFLIIDDICDGGATFNRASLFLHSAFCNSTVGLYTTHGIYSKGFEGMINSGITKFYTTQSLIQNVNGYKLQEV